MISTPRRSATNAHADEHKCEQQQYRRRRLGHGRRIGTAGQASSGTRAVAAGTTLAEVRPPYVIMILYVGDAKPLRKRTKSAASTSPSLLKSSGEPEPVTDNTPVV